MRRVCALLCCLLFATRCSEPPQKEIDRAQGAIDTARAAGAEQYAAAEFAEAQTALQQSHDAVNQRDYRLALSRALDASHRAQDSARQAADGQAKSRSAAEVDVHSAATTLQQLESKIAASRASDVDLKAAQQTASDGQRTLQEARSALAAGKYPDARERLKESIARMSAQMQAMDEAARSRPAKRRR